MPNPKPTPPFDAFPEDHASYIAGDMDMDEFIPIAVEKPAPSGYTGCFALVCAAVIGLASGFLIALAGGHIACYALGLEFPWP